MKGEVGGGRGTGGGQPIGGMERQEEGRLRPGLADPEVDYLDKRIGGWIPASARMTARGGMGNLADLVDRLPLPAPRFRGDRFRGDDVWEDEG